MKLPKLFLSVFVASMLTAGLALAADEKPQTAEAKKAGCCVKAEKDGKACGHACCVEAMEAGKNCEKCGGSGLAEKK
jgi:hypothetical protein